MRLGWAKGMVVVALAALAAGGSALAADVGANDDTGKFAEDREAFFGRMATLGLRQTVITVRFTPSEGSAIPDQREVAQAVEAATRKGVRVVLALYPYPPREIQAGLLRPDHFAAWAVGVLRAFPQVRQVVIGNEPNQPAFWRPQFDRKGRVASAPAFGRLLAAAYDAIKAHDPSVTVVGVGLSPRGNDDPRAKTNVSTSPVRFLRALGDWYRRSGRSEPLMDGFSFHPYPGRATDALARGYDWPGAGFVNLDRVKLALWDAFAGTAQPTTVSGLKLYLDEVGWQVDTSGREGYVGLENVPVTDEATQARIYAEIVRRAACDADVAQVNFFGFHDDQVRAAGFQSGLHRVDGTPRAAAGAVAAALAKRCAGRAVRWSPPKTVAGASLAPPRLQRSGALKSLVGAKEGAQAVVCLVPAQTSATRFTASAGAIEKLAVAPCWRGRLTPRQRLDVRLQPPPGLGIPLWVAARISAEANPGRASVLVAAPK